VAGAGSVTFEPGYSFDFAVNAERSTTGEVSGLVVGTQYWPDYSVRFRIDVKCMFVSDNRVRVGGTFINYVDSGVGGDVPAPYSHGSFTFVDNGVPSAGTPDAASLNLWIGAPSNYDVCEGGAGLDGPGVWPGLTRGNVVVRTTD
jgi:hypothetical protein